MAVRVADQGSASAAIISTSQTWLSVKQLPKGTPVTIPVPTPPRFSTLRLMAKGSQVVVSPGRVRLDSVAVASIVSEPDSGEPPKCQDGKAPAAPANVALASSPI